MRKGGSSKKGGAFERLIAKTLSLWWDKDEDDIFYRTQGSGNRATSRAKKGKKTANHNGDISSSDERGIHFTKLLTVSLKRGYPYTTLFDVVDERGTSSKWRQFIYEARRDSDAGGTLSWLIIGQRDRREAMVYMPEFLFNALVSVGAKLVVEKLFPCMCIQAEVGRHIEHVYVFPFKEFLKKVNPKRIHKLYRYRKHHKSFDQRGKRTRGGNSLTKQLKALLKD